MAVEKVEYPKEFKNSEWQKKKGALGNLMGKKESGLKAILEPMARFYDNINWDALVAWVNDPPTADNAERLLVSEGRVNSDMGNLRGIMKKLDILANQIVEILPDFATNKVVLKSQIEYLQLMKKKSAPFKKEIKDVIAACAKQNVKLRLAGVDAAAIDQLTVAGIIGDGKMRKSFRDFLEEDTAGENLDFILAVGAGVSTKPQANTVYDNYVAAGELNIENFPEFETLRANNWQDNGTDVDLKSLFTGAVAHLLFTLKQDALPRFKIWLKDRK